jgi:hypothetical protein
MQLAPATRILPLDPTVATRAVGALKYVEQVHSRMIDRSIAVRVMLDRDLQAKRFSPDTLHAVDLLVRARKYGLEGVDSHLTHEVTEPVMDWARRADHPGTETVTTALWDARRAVEDLLDDDEGNIRDSIETMRTEPGANSWQAVRDALDWSLGTLYEARRESQDARYTLNDVSGQR